MSFLPSSSLDFDDEEQLYGSRNQERKQGDIGPWVLPLLSTGETNNVKTAQKKQSRQENTADFLSIINNNPQNVVRFRPKIGKQKSESIKDVNRDSNGTARNPFKRTCYFNYPLPESDSLMKEKKSCPTVKKAPLNATMYVYMQNKEASPRRPTAHTSRSETITQFNPFREDFSPPHVPFSQGNRNLQRILRVKQKIRAKKSGLVQKQKEKMAHAAAELSPSKMKEQIESLHHKAWVSIDLRANQEQEFEGDFNFNKGGELEPSPIGRGRKHWRKYATLKQC